MEISFFMQGYIFIQMPTDLKYYLYPTLNFFINVGFSTYLTELSIYSYVSNTFLISYCFNYF